MPTLHWVGKDKVVNHHHDVPFRVLNKVSTFTAPAGLPANSTDNRIIHGDNLEALKSLLPEFEGRVNCIYIDPPYNTGNEGWVYNDAVNDPKIKRWLGQVVGKEGEDLSRHDKWLCMMYPRLRMLHKLLTQDGVLFVSIDGNEMANLSLLINEVFGASNFLARFIWKRKAGGGDDNEHIATEHEYVLCYAKKKSEVRISRVLHESPAMTAKYNRLENGRRYYLERLDKTSLTYSESMDFPIECPDGSSIKPPQPDPRNPTTAWRWGPKTVESRRDELEFHRDRKTKEWRIYTRTWEPREGVTPRSLLVEKDYGRNRDGTQELDAILGPKKFNNPKPTKLLLHLLAIGAPEKDAVVLDSFAGSGSTAHAVLKMNALDAGNRRFILCEAMDYAQTITAERVRRVMAGYSQPDGKPMAGLGGGFDYYTVGQPMFLADDILNEAVGTQAIRGYVAYSEGIPATDRATTDNPHSPYLLGLNHETAWIFNYEPDRATSLDMDFLASLRFGGTTGASKPGAVIIYADRCLLSAEFMAKHGIIFKKIPRDITRF